jgi:pyruvate/2-oxoglutarate/acetoin dehydrogenase E1 component
MERKITYTEAIREAIDSELSRDPNVIVFGLDVDDPKATFGTHKGLVAKYGPERVFGTPLAEDGMTGAAVGMALAGLRPIHIHYRMDFATLAMNQLINVAAKTHYMFGGEQHVPLTVRMMIGKSWGQGAQHSQSLYPLFMNIPGLKIAVPSTPYDAKGTLAYSIRDDNPVIYVEHRLLHFTKGFVPENEIIVSPGKARVTTSGTDATVVGISYMQLECLKACEYLKDIGINVEVIDPIWLSPLDLDTIEESVRKTRNLIVVDNAWTTCGAGAEIISSLHERLSDINWKSKKIGFTFVPCPTTPSLENEFYPNARTIASQIHTMLNKSEWMPDEKADLKEIEFKGPF